MAAASADAGQAKDRLQDPAARRYRLPASVSHDFTPDVRRAQQKHALDAISHAFDSLRVFQAICTSLRERDEKHHLSQAVHVLEQNFFASICHQLTFVGFIALKVEIATEALDSIEQHAPYTEPVVMVRFAESQTLTHFIRTHEPMLREALSHELEVPLDRVFFISIYSHLDLQKMGHDSQYTRRVSWKKIVWQMQHKEADIIPGKPSAPS